MKEIIDWIWENKVAIATTIPLITRAYYSIVSGGGIVGMVRAILFGTNTPKQK